MNKKYEIEVECKVTRTAKVIASDEYDACEQAKKELEDDINGYVDDAEIEDLDATSYSDGVLWGWTSQTQYDTDRQYYGATEDLWHRQEHLYHASQQGNYVLLWRDDDVKYCYAVLGTIEDLTADILDKIFEIVECDELDKYCRKYEYDDIEWEDDDDETSYCPDSLEDVAYTMPNWFCNELDDIEPLSQWKNSINIEAITQELKDKYSSEYIQRPGADVTLESIISDAIQWAFDNHESEQTTIEDSADAFAYESVKFNKLWHRVNSLHNGDIVLLYYRVTNDSSLAHGWHIVEFHKANIQLAELHDCKKDQFIFMDAQCIHDSISKGLEKYISIGLSDIGELHVLRNSSDSDRIKTLEYQLEQIKSVLN